MRFSFTSWDCVYGHLPFYRAEHEKFQMYDGMDVEKLGNAGYYIAKAGVRSQGNPAQRKNSKKVRKEV